MKYVKKIANVIYMYTHVHVTQTHSLHLETNSHKMHERLIISQFYIKNVRKKYWKIDNSMTSPLSLKFLDSKFISSLIGESLNKNLILQWECDNSQFVYYNGNVVVVQVRVSYELP